MTTAEPRSYPFSKVEKLDTEPMFAKLRAEEPLIRVRLPFGEPAWMATRYEDVKTVLGDPRFSRAAAVGRDEPRSRPNVAPSSSILSMDPPDHTRIRKLVRKAFTTRRVEQLRPRVQQIADEFLDAMIDGGSPADLVEGFAMPLPVTVICELLGVPYGDRDDFRYWSDAFLSTTRYTKDEVDACQSRMLEYFAKLIAARRDDPQDDLLSAMVVARDEDDRLTEEELLMLATALLVAGHETTATQIPNFVYALLTHPGQLAELRANPDLMPRAVEELMRFVPLGLGGGIARYALEDVELSGVTVRAGEPVVPVIASANQDESAFPNPEELDILRENASHVGFGHGVHHCLGAPLARMELQIALSTLITRLPGLRFADPEGGIDWKEGLSTRGPERLMLAWDEPR